MTRPLPNEPGDTALALGQRRVDPANGSEWYIAGINSRRVWLHRGARSQRYYRRPPRSVPVSQVESWALANPPKDWPTEGF